MINTKNNNTDENPLEVKILSILTDNEFCRKKLDGEEEKKMAEIIKKIIMNKMPILITVLFGGYKSPHTGLTDPCLAEVKTLQRLNFLLVKLRMIYPYGAQLYVITTGRKGEIANGVSPAITSSYENKIIKIANNFEGIKVIPIKLLYEKFFNNGNMKAVIEEEKKKQAKLLKDPNFLAEKIKIAQRHGSLPLSDLDEESKKKAIENALTYSALSSVEQGMLLKEFDTFIKLSFRKEGEKNAISLYTCRKKMIHQPWNNNCKGCTREEKCFAESKNGRILYT